MKPRHLPPILGLLLLIGCQPDTTRSSPVSADPSPSEVPSSVTIIAVTPEQLQGLWRVVTIAGEPVAENSPARIQFTDDGNINGNASCNRFFGTYVYTGQTLTIRKPLGATKMMCLPALMEQEGQLLSSLGDAVSVGLEEGNLVIRNLLGDAILEALPEES